MKVVILAGGFGTRMSEETAAIPKPLVEIGGKPLLWHIMKIYSSQGFNDFIIACGYKGEKIKEYFSKLHLYENDLSIDTSANRVTVNGNFTEDWKVQVVDTGLNTMTGGRLKRLAPYIDGDTFMATYGDGLADIDIKRLLDFHKAHGNLATVTAVRMPRFGILDIANDNKVVAFQEKRLDNTPYINAGFFVLNKAVLGYISGDDVAFETTPLQTLANEGKLMAYKHHGFWRPCDSLNDKRILEEIWMSGQAPWKIW